MTATTIRAPKSDHRMSIRRVGSDMLIVTVTLKYARSTEVKTYSVLQAPDAGPALCYTFARHGGGKLYRTSYDPGTNAKGCDCKGHKIGGFCCHADALAVLYHRGSLVAHDPSF